MAVLDALVDDAFDSDGLLATSFAVLVLQAGEVVAERYGTLPGGQVVGPETPLRSWSMAKSMLHAAIGVLVADGRLAVDEPAPVHAWSGDPRSGITIEDLLAMRDGLDFNEDYVDGERSDTIEMLFGSGMEDVAAYAVGRPLAVTPGTRFNYSSGTSNVLASIVGDVVGRGDRYEQFLRDALFAPLGMASARPELDAAGTWVASSYVFATARDFARFGQLYLGRGEDLLPSSWVEHGLRPRSYDEESDSRYGAHWWLPAEGVFEARGYEGQSITVCPAKDLVVVRLGCTPAERNVPLRAWRAAMVDAA
ncbi:MAG: penicillin-binding protein beta-lactamase class [Actinomycetia bacterium]|nr:penicillin-binding protein beta-lactamase class [Actinomycetes bacterium]